MSRFVSGIYTGAVTHRRFKPRRHNLRYRLFMLLIDLDEVEALDRERRLFAYNRPGLLSFHDADHGDGSAEPLKRQIERQLRAAGLPAGGPIRILCLPRVLGFVFNPLSEIYCHGPDGRLAAIVHQVTNTFGERHSYLLAVQERDGDAVRQACAKRFYVSPFMDMDLTYDFRIAPPGERASTAIRVSDAAGPVLAAAFAGERRPITDANLLEAWLGHPLVTLKVVLGIHWEALRLWLKGMRLRRRPAAPAQPYTVQVPAAPRRAEAA
jgi:DUF1365 family protein